ncbi:DNA-binding MarR family transcriptional regulator [Palleronia aestuarii]|uniref:DNA-binding MarR family transcriptional regulator n=1 Tax=Palleronia aestuarii TaxID=568105 RepID=A0A2W7NFT3_9RHOB|nr:MarR family transcriptional regulator [Palleronia aestuarii]PZX17037.1 DNA-binding MarR family transcriptional regulator [Palleronia aestuarii]
MPISRSDPETAVAAAEADDAGRGYVLDEQIGFVLRRAYQRNSMIFAERVPGPLTPTQFSVMCRLDEAGPLSQNRLGRSVAMDAATTKGVVDRLIGRGLLATRRDPEDGRRHLVYLTAAGAELIDAARPAAAEVTEETLAPLTAPERRRLLHLLSKLA